MLTGESERFNVNYGLGMYNIGDYRYSAPVSAEFRQTREVFGCDRAVWPNVPAACYPE